jgi:hypothetical protein
MKTAAFALVLACLAKAGAQFPATPVSFTCRAGTADHVLAALGKATGVRLEATRGTAGEVLVVSVANTPLRDVMARIATVTSSEWQYDHATYRLVASDALRRKEEAEALVTRVAAVRKAIEKGMAPPAPSKPGDVDAQAQARAAATGPFGGEGSRHIYEILNAVDPATIAGLAPNERVVFSSRPTAMQRPFSDDVTAATNAIIAEHNAAVAKNSNQAAEVNGIAGAETPGFLKTMLDRMNKPVGNVSKVLLILSRMSFGGFGMLSAAVRMYDPDGKIALDQQVNLDILGIGMSEIMAAVGPTGTGPAKPATSASTPVPLSDDTKAFQGVFDMGSMSGVRPAAMTPAVKEKIYHPERYDPLSFVVTDEVFAIAKKQGRPVVADLSDGTSLTQQLFDKTPTVETAEKQLEQGYVQRVVPDPMFLVIKPANPAESRADRLDRGALADLLRASDTKGVPTLDDIAAYSLRAPSPMDGGIGMLYVVMLAPGAFAQNMSGLTSWELLRLDGSLDSTRRETLIAGGAIPFSSLNAYQMDQVHRMAFGAIPMLEADDPSQKPEERLPAFMRTFVGGTLNDYRDEPTELLPNGIPADGFLTVKATQEPFASPVSAAGTIASGPTAVLDAETLATYKMLRESPMFSQVSGMMPNPSRARIGQRTIYAFTFHIAPKVSMQSSLNDNRLDTSSAIVSMTTLPTDLQKAVDGKYAELKKSPLGAMAAMSMLGGGAAGIRP